MTVKEIVYCTQVVATIRIWVLFVGHKTQCPQIDIKLTQFEDNDGVKILLAEVL